MPPPPPPAPFRLQRGKRIGYVSAPTSVPPNTITPAATLALLTATARRLFPVPVDATDSGPRLMVTATGSGETSGGGGASRGGGPGSSGGSSRSAGGKWVLLDEAILVSGAPLPVVAVCYERTCGWETGEDALAEGAV